MKPTTIVMACFIAATVGFLVGTILGAFSVTGAAHAEKTRYPPPVGDQFREGPVLVRLPSAATDTTSFIF